MQAEADDVGAQRLSHRRRARHRALQREHPATGSGTAGDPVRDGRRLQRPAARLGIVVVGLGHVGLSLVGRQHATTREQLHQPSDDRPQHGPHLLVRGCRRFDELALAGGAAPVHPVQHQAVHADVQVRGRALPSQTRLDLRDGAAVAVITRDPGLLQQVPLEHTLHPLQHRGDRYGLRSQQQSQRDRHRQQPLPHRHGRDDVVNEVGCGLRHAPRTARGTEPSALAAEGDPLVVATVGW
jgi:hypothetical protein